MDKVAMKEALRQAWMEDFQVQTVSDDDNFFQAGGNSIKALELTARLAQKGVKLELGSVFSAQTFGKIADTLEEAEPVASPREHIAKEVAKSVYGGAGSQPYSAPAMPQYMAPAMPQYMAPAMPPAPMPGFVMVPVLMPVMMPAYYDYNAMPQMPMQQAPMPQMPAQPTGFGFGFGGPAASAQPAAGNAPQKSAEEVLHEALNGLIPNFDKERNLFEQGLTSLDVLKVIARCSENGYQLDMESVFLSPKFADIAAAMKPEA